MRYIEDALDVAFSAAQELCVQSTCPLISASSRSSLFSRMLSQSRTDADNIRTGALAFTSLGQRKKAAMVGSGEKRETQKEEEEEEGKREEIEGKGRERARETERERAREKERREVTPHCPGHPKAIAKPKFPPR